MTDEASRHIDEAATETAVNPAVAPAPKRPEPRGATSTKRSDKLPLLTFLGRNQRGTGVLAGGAVGVLLLGAIALVVALVAVTIAIGRAPQEAAANPRATVTQTTPSAPTSFTSPEPTGVRWTPLPIQTGVPQFQPSYEPTPTPKPTPSTTQAAAPAEPGPPAEATEFGRPDPPGQTNAPPG